MSILVTGGAGYIGSHTLVELIEAGFEPVVIDNLCNSKEDSLKRVETITGKPVKFYNGDLKNTGDIESVFHNEKITAVIHFAGLKAVGESVKYPQEYYENNVSGTLNLLKAMKNNNVNSIIFSSSATVYGASKVVPIKEDFPLSAASPYGSTKLMIETFIKDICAASEEFNAVILRYFNPIGAHKSGLIGEDPKGIPNNLMPYITQVAFKKQKKLSIFGNDYPTADGTGVRDYIHVVDLALGHVAALKKLEEECGLKIYNLGTGVGYSVLDVVNTFASVNKKKIPYVFAARRQGDIAECYADASLARTDLKWSAKFGLEEMCRDAYNFQKKNPDGY